MIEYNEPATHAKPLPLGDLTAAPRKTLSLAIDTLQSAGLLGLSDKKRHAALKGLSSGAIKEIQTSLVNAGFKDVGKIDGIAGDKTIRGIEQALAKNTLTEIFAEHDASDRETVTRIQESLNTLGHKAGKADGVLGPVTAGAIGRFLNKDHVGGETLPANVSEQLKAHRIKLEAKAPAGIPDPAVLGHTEPAIIAALGAYKQNEEDVMLVQAHLKSKGYYDDKVDGKFGPNTTKAFVKFLEENPDYHSAVGPDLLMKTEAYAAGNKVSDELRRSLNLRDLSKLSTPDDEIRYNAYKEYFASQGRPEELARGIQVASKLTGVPMKDLFALMKQESAFGDYNPRYGNSSANRIANNFGQFTDGTYKHMNNTYGSIARRELGREGIHVGGKDWRSDPLVAPYMTARYLKEMGGSYAAYVLPVMRYKGNSSDIVARHYPEAARSNRHLFYDHGRPVSFAEAKQRILGTLADDYRVERKIVVTAQREALKKGMLIRQSTDKAHDKPEDSKIRMDDKGVIRHNTDGVHDKLRGIEIKNDKIYMDDRIIPEKHDIDAKRSAGLVGDNNNPEKSAAKLNLAGSFKQAALADIPANLSPDPNGQGPKPSGWAPLTNDFC